ncbi:MAG: hypothetical protein GY754_31150 [bacterium]|nr:hypothetical protein [bacterium]
MKSKFALTAIVFTIISVFLTGISYANPVETEPVKEETTENQTEKQHIDDFSDRLIIRPFLRIPIFFIDIVEKSNDEYIVYMPNFSLAGGLGVSYNIFRLSFQRTIPGTSDDEALYEKTDYYDFQFFF